jgi:hypothetical protein
MSLNNLDVLRYLNETNQIQGSLNNGLQNLLLGSAISPALALQSNLRAPFSVPNFQNQVQYELIYQMLLLKKQSLQNSTLQNSHLTPQTLLNPQNFGASFMMGENRQSLNMGISMTQMSKNIFNPSQNYFPYQEFPTTLTKNNLEIFKTISTRSKELHIDNIQSNLIRQEENEMKEYETEFIENINKISPNLSLSENSLGSVPDPTTLESKICFLN